MKLKVIIGDSFSKQLNIYLTLSYETSRYSCNWRYIPIVLENIVRARAQQALAAKEICPDLNVLLTTVAPIVTI